MPVGLGSSFKYVVPAIGEFRHRVTFQLFSSTPDGQGGQVQSWTDSLTVWGKLEPVKAWEAMQANTLLYRRSHTLWVRWNSSFDMKLLTNYRVTFDGRTWDVKGGRRVDERRFFLVFDLEENAP